MIHPARWAAGALLAALLGCAAAPPATGAPPSPASTGEAAEAEISATLARALAGGPAADSLFSPDATLIADGVRVVDGPRFAALGPGGAPAIASSQVDVRSGIAWALLDYRWVAPEANLAREAWATVILGPKPGGGWWIVHAQSSTVR